MCWLVFSLFHEFFVRYFSVLLNRSSFAYIDLVKTISCICCCSTILNPEIISLCCRFTSSLDLPWFSWMLINVKHSSIMNFTTQLLWLYTNFDFPFIYFIILLHPMTLCMCRGTLAVFSHNKIVLFQIVKSRSVNITSQCHGEQMIIQQYDKV